jgi:hypothetical protein
VGRKARTDAGRAARAQCPCHARLCESAGTAARGSAARRPADCGTRHRLAAAARQRRPEPYVPYPPNSSSSSSSSLPFTRWPRGRGADPGD